MPQNYGIKNCSPIWGLKENACVGQVSAFPYKIGDCLGLDIKFMTQSQNILQSVAIEPKPRSDSPSGDGFTN
jgi:hypothetical protein